jgi:hypothetical protein
MRVIGISNHQMALESPSIEIMHIIGSFAINNAIIDRMHILL